MDARRVLSPDEYVLRRITAFKVVNGFPFGHFVPTREDTDGLTVWQRSIKSPQDLVDGQKNKFGYYVAQFRVEELAAIGLTVILTDDVAPGHASLPECSWQAYQDDKVGVTEKLMRLAGLAWERTVLGPTQPLA